MKKINFKNLFKAGNRSDDFGTAVAWPVNFVRDWRVIVLIFAVGLIFLSSFGLQIYLSNQIAGGYLTPILSSSDATVKTINLKKLNTDVAIMDARQVNFNKLKSTQSKLADPSN